MSERMSDSCVMQVIVLFEMQATWQVLSCLLDLLRAEFTSAPNLTAAAAAQNLTWAPVSVSAVSVDSYDLAMNTSDSALLTLSLSANLGVSGDISDVAPAAGTSRRRHLLQTASGLFVSCVDSAPEHGRYCSVVVCS